MDEGIRGDKGEKDKVGGWAMAHDPHKGSGVRAWTRPAESLASRPERIVSLIIMLDIKAQHDE